MEKYLERNSVGLDFCRKFLKNKKMICNKSEPFTPSSCAEHEGLYEF